MNNIQEQDKHYFSKSGLQSLKSDIELVFAIGAEIKLLKKGKRFFGRCPICEEKKLSLVISTAKNLWYCFKCKKGGSIIDWLMFSEKLKLVEALAVLAERYPFLANKGQLGEQGLPSTVLRARNEAIPDTKHLPSHQPTLQKIINHYHSCLYKRPATEGIQSKAIRYLRSMGISHKALKRHKIGFCDSSLVRGFLERVTNNLDALVDEDIQYLEMLPSSQEMQAPVREYFNGKIVFPVVNEQNQCIQLFGRQIPKTIKIAQVSLVVSGGLSRSA